MHRGTLTFCYVLWVYCSGMSNEDSSNKDSKEVTGRNQCHSMSVTSWPGISLLRAAELHREVEAEPHQSNNVHYWRTDHRGCKKLGWDVPAAVTGIKKNLLHTLHGYQSSEATKTDLLSQKQADCFFAVCKVVSRATRMQLYRLRVN